MTDQVLGAVTPGRPHWLCRAICALGGIVKSALTGPDGVSWAPGRIMAAVVFAVSECLVVRASQQMLGRPMDPNNWMVMFQAVAMFEGAITAVCWGLIVGVGVGENGGGFWKAGAPEKVGQ